MGEADDADAQPKALSWVWFVAGLGIEAAQAENDEKGSSMTVQEPPRPLFDWAIFLVIHVALVGGIALAGFNVYGHYLGAWVGVSAFIAGCVGLFFFRYEVPGEILMKIALYVAMAANAAYIIHNGAKAAGVEAFNLAQVKKFEAGVSAASRATSRGVARQIGLSARDASQLEKVFGDEVSVTAGVLGGLEILLAMVFLSVGMSLKQRRARVREFPQLDTEDIRPKVPPRPQP